MYVLLVSWNPKFQLVSLYDQPFSNYRPFWDKCTEWPPKASEHYKGKGAQYTLLKLNI